MANILTFQPRRSVVCTPLPKGGPASVIIFPGVRYERLGDDKILRRTPARSSKPRKKA